MMMRCQLLGRILIGGNLGVRETEPLLLSLLWSRETHVCLFGVIHLPQVTGLEKSPLHCAQL